MGDYEKAIREAEKMWAAAKVKAEQEALAAKGAGGQGRFVSNAGAVPLNKAKVRNLGGLRS